MTFNHRNINNLDIYKCAISPAINLILSTELPLLLVKIKIIIPAI